MVKLIKILKLDTMKNISLKNNIENKFKHILKITTQNQNTFNIKIQKYLYKISFRRTLRM